MKRFYVILLSIFLLFSLFGCSQNSSNENTPTPKSPEASPIIISAQAQAEFELNKYIEQNEDVNFAGAVVIVKKQGTFSAFQYAEKTGLHILYENATTSKIPYRMKEITPENSTQIVRIFTFDADFEADYDVINSMYDAINERRYEDYAGLIFESPNQSIQSFSGLTMLSDIGDEEAIEQKKGIYNIDKVSDIEVLAVMPLDSVYAESWQKYVIPQTLSAIDPNDPATIKSYFDRNDPMIYLVRNEFLMINEQDSNEIKSGTQYWIIAIGNIDGVRKIQGVWMPQDDTILEYEPDNARAQEYLGRS
ncbi:MAG: hypothetical protein GX802_07455 [Clostridiales bacterium]|nr:hypothetical protein [Clostridiales bacterium]